MKRELILAQARSSGPFDEYWTTMCASRHNPVIRGYDPQLVKRNFSRQPSLRIAGFLFFLSRRPHVTSYEQMPGSPIDSG
ncbi:MAG: hypothetical protein H7237_05665 [Alkalinema sp. FL-bin-369]|nr:hypothetical protein [Leptolyngbyaceae cyanobacterium LF-bin-369]